MTAWTTRRAVSLSPRSTGRLAPRSAGPLVREALTTWVATRVAVMTVAFAGLWMLGTTRASAVPSFLSRWNQWDAQLFIALGHYGYRGYGSHIDKHHLEALFPGEPMALRLGYWATGSWVAGGLVISAIAGAVAVVALAKLGELETGADGAACGRRAVLYLTLSPYAVFLAAGYSEALFLGFALPSWLAARRGRWLAAGLLAGAAAVVRIDGVFLGVALCVQWLTTDRRLTWRLAALSAPFVATFGYFAYLRAITGDWLAWSHAQAAGWSRTFTAPWRAFHASWQAAFSPRPYSHYEWAFRAEIVAVLVGVALTVLLVVWRRWGEATYVGLQVVGLACSAYYRSVPRATLMWFPLWLLLARASLRWRWVNPVYLAVAPALMAVGVLTFTSGHWLN
ncbi:MAG TPA: hypothetical protein VG650_11975 [Mycobacteriales bacterium]|nr:hypothetical protein [Mycobacteriales bacterium]